MKRIVSILLAVLIFISALSCIAYAQDNENIPWIFVHGMNGYGENSSKNDKTPYWGKNENDLMTYLRSEGYDVYAPSIGPVSSCWDRACELYAQLTGTVVDYGAAHSEKYGHNRYGRDYTGQATMGKEWDLDSKINLIAHSLGGPTTRIFVSLISYGNTEELAATGEDTSPLFKGGHSDSINAVVTLAGPHNGTHLTDFALGTNLVPFAVCVVALFAPKTVNDFFMLEQFNIVGKNGITNIKNALNFAKEDNCGTDITLKGAAAINENYPLPETALYVTSSASITKEGLFGHQIGMPADGVYSLSAELISLTARKDYDGFVPGKEWEANDGLVPVISARYPLNGNIGYVEYNEGDELQRGVWTALPTIVGTHSYYTGGFGGSDDYFDFYDSIFELVVTNS